MLFNIIKKEVINNNNKDYLTMSFSKKTRTNKIFYYDFKNKKIESNQINKEFYMKNYLHERINDLNLNIFYKYKELMIVNYEKYKNILILKRIEYDYNEDLNKVMEFIFYDNLFINKENKLIHMINFKENSFFNEEEIDSYKKLKGTIEIDLLNNKSINHFIKESNYYFEKNKMIHRTNLVNFFKFSKINVYFSKRKARPYIGQIVHEKNFLLNFTNKKLNYNNLFNESELFKEYIINHFNLPNYFNKNRDLYNLFHQIEYPSLETTWFKFNKTEITDSIFYDCLFENEEITSLKDIKNVENNKSINELLKEISIDDLKNKSLFFKKNTNKLLKDKIIFVDKEEGAKIEKRYLDNNFDFIPFLLFKNKDNLDKFISYYNPLYLDKEYNKFQTIEIYLDKDLVSPDDKRNYKKERHGNSYRLTRQEILYLMSKRFADYKYFENYLIELVKNNDFYHEYHLMDLLNILYKIVYLYEYNNLKDDDRVIVEEFLKKKYTNVNEFETDLYTCNTFLKKDSLKEIIPINKKLKLKAIDDSYYFKQPESAFELKVVGDVMHHCVFNYLGEIKDKKRKKEIVVLYEKMNEKEDYPIVCLELYKTKNNYKCVQAKCKYNKRVKDDKKLKDIIVSFLKENSIKIDTLDISDDCNN